MSLTTETIKQVEEALEPYARSRDEISQIRRILAAHLQSCVDHEELPHPLSLPTSTSKVTPTQELRGLQREYIKALNSNIKAQQAFRKIQQEPAPPQHSQAPGHGDRLEEHLASLRLQKKQEKLETVDRYLEVLSARPAAQTDFLDSDKVFDGGLTLPGVPKKVVDGFAVDGTSGKTDLKDLNRQLEKAVLRAKLLLGQEEKLLEDIRSRSAQFTGRISDLSKFQALTATRSELISWIESELSNASADDDEDEDATQSGSRANGNASWGEVEAQLKRIRDKYAQYISARKLLVQTVSQNPQPTMKPRTEDSTSDIATMAQPPAPPTYLYSPYLESMLAGTQDQKLLIAQKSHLNVILGKESKSTAQSLDHLAEESRIIPLYPLQPRRRAALDEGLGVTQDTGSTSSRARAWAYAADAAKIALLEAVAEKVEEGQVALEGSMQVLDQIDQLLGQQGETGESQVLEESDIWLAEVGTGGKAANLKATIKKAEVADIWSGLDGRLGLLAPDGETT